MVQPIFQSTLSVRRATYAASLTSSFFLFQSTLSVRRATQPATSSANSARFQSTLSVRRATQRGAIHLPIASISIHALRKESDKRGNHYPAHCYKFQSTLSVRRATTTRHSRTIQCKFQSTLSVRRATAYPYESRYRPRYFNPRSP